MEWLKARSIGGLLLAGFLAIYGVSLLIGGTAIPAWFIGLVAVAAAVCILVGV